MMCDDKRHKNIFEKDMSIVNKNNQILNEEDYE